MQSMTEKTELVVAATEAAQWDAYRATGDASARGALLERHLGLVYLNARRMAKRVGTMADFDDLVSAGTLGLVQALEAYDPARGHTFSTYAMRRIHGAMLDELRMLDWRPRSVRRQERAIRTVVDDLERSLGRSAEPSEVARALGVPLEAYWRMRENGEGRRWCSLQADRAQDGSVNGVHEETLADSEAMTPFSKLEREDQVAALAHLLHRLAPRERTILALSFYEELSLKEIGATLHVSESRVCQIRTRALKRLRELVASEGFSG